MADKQLTVKIEGKDNLSPIFKKIGAEATSATKQMTTGAKSAEKSLDQLATSTQQAEQRAKSLESANRAIGVGFAALGASIGLYSREIINNQQAVATLERTYGTAANGLQDFANQIQQTTVYSSEQAIQAENLFGTLVRNYGLSVQQVQQLVQVSADLAATSGLTLEDAASRVQAAIRGEAEAAEALGLTMNQQAIDREGLTLTMSNQEAAQYRLNALMEQSAFATGAAAQQADTTAGKVRQLTNSFDDAARGAIGMLGPLPDVVGGLSNMGLQAGLAIGGIGSLVKGLGSLATAMKGVTVAETAAGSGGLLSGLGGALGVGGGGSGLVGALTALAPAAIAATAALTPLIATLVVAYEQGEKHADSISAQTDAINEWAQSIGDPALRQNFIYFAQDIRDLNTAVQDMKTGEVHDITDALDELLALNPGDLAKVTEILHAAGIEIGNLDNLDADQLEVVFNTINQVYAEHIDYVRQTAEVEASHQQAITDLEEQYGSLTPAVEASGKALASWTLYMMANEIAARKQVSAVKDVTAAYHELAESTDLLLTKAGVQAEAQNEVNRILDEARGTLGSYTDDQIKQQQAASEAAATNKGEYAGSLQSVSTQLKASTSDGSAFGDMLAEQQKIVEDFAAQTMDAAKSIGVFSTNAQLFQAAGIKAPSLDVAVNLQTGQGAFDAVFGAIKQAQSLSSSIGGAKSWADELIGDPGTWSELDKLLEEGRINVDQYNAAQAAQVRISKDVTNAQRDLLAVQTNLAPALADVTHQQAEYISSLQGMNAQQQIAALGFMDSAESAKAMQIAQLAAASSTDAMQASTTALITQAAAADPVLKEMLLSMGLISETDGVITVNFDEANSANDAINNLTESIDALIVALGGIPPIHTESNASDTQKDVDGLTDAINDIPDSSTTVIEVLDNASDTIAAVGQQLRNLDGQTARTQIDSFLNTYQNTFVNTQYSTTPVPGGAAATGTTISPDIPRYAIGGTHAGSMALVGEAGPEVVWLPTGAQVTNAVASRSKRQSIEARRGGDINIYGPMTLNPAGSDAYAAIQQEMMGGARR